MTEDINKKRKIDDETNETSNEVSSGALFDYHKYCDITWCIVLRDR